MKRRTLLGAIGIWLIAGCLSQEDPGENSPSEPTDISPTSSPPTETTIPDRGNVSAGETVRVTLGTGTLTEDGSRKPHGVALKNSTADRQTSSFTVRRPDGSVVHDETYELGSEAVVLVVLTDPLRYSATASLHGTDVSETTTVALESFDCNSSSTTIDIVTDDRVEIETITTLVLCTNLESEHVNVGDEHSLSLGDGSLPDGDRKPHGVRITNPTDDTWTTRLLIERDGAVLLDGLYTLESEAAARVKLTEMDDYRGTVSVPISGATRTFEPGPFDCNDSSTIATVASSGELDVKSITTDIACQTDTDGNESAGE